MLFQRSTEEIALAALGAGEEEVVAPVTSPILVLLHACDEDARLVLEPLPQMGLSYLPVGWSNADVVKEYLSENSHLKSVRGFVSELCSSATGPLVLPVAIRDVFMLTRLGVFDLFTGQAAYAFLARVRAPVMAVTDVLDRVSLETASIGDLEEDDFEAIFTNTFQMRQQAALVEAFMHTTFRAPDTVLFETWRANPKIFYTRLLAPFNIECTDDALTTSEPKERVEFEQRLNQWFLEKAKRTFLRWADEGWPVDAD